MRFVYAESMIDPSYYIPLARTAEEVGFDGITIADSLCYPKEADSEYPYNPDGSREFLDGKPFIDPWVHMSAVGAVTERLEFATFVIKAPVRHPVHIAKMTTSAAVMTGGRVLLGVGVSPWKEDYEITGTPWQRRGKRLDETMEIVAGLMSGEYFSYRGEIYEIPSIKLCPVPEAPVPLLVGGHSEPALRRAARLGDGWMHAGGGDEKLPDMLARLTELRREYGREDEPFRIYAASADAYTPEGVQALEEQGVTDAIVGFRWPYHEGPDPETLDKKLDDLRRYADDVISKVRG